MVEKVKFSALSGQKLTSWPGISEQLIYRHLGLDSHLWVSRCQSVFKGGGRKMSKCLAELLEWAGGRGHLLLSLSPETVELRIPWLNLNYRWCLFNTKRSVCVIISVIFIYLAWWFYKCCSFQRGSALESLADSPPSPSLAMAIVARQLAEVRLRRHAHGQIRSNWVWRAWPTCEPREVDLGPCRERGLCDSDPWCWCLHWNHVGAEPWSQGL